VGRGESTDFGEKKKGIISLATESRQKIWGVASHRMELEDHKGYAGGSK